MKNIFDFNLFYNGISVQYTNSPIISEREIHSYHELLVIDGENLTLRTENKSTEISSKALVVIPKGSYHLFNFCGNEFKRLKISITDEILKTLPVSVFNFGVLAVNGLSQSIFSLIDRLTELSEREESVRSGFYAYSAVMMLLSSLNEFDLESHYVFSLRESRSIAHKICGYVSKNLKEELSVSKLSKEFGTSESFLTHSFKKEVGISLHRYIVGKRMAYAKDKIEKGELPTKIYRECGFGDYSSFYKAYLAYFGTMPSASKS